MSRIGLLCFSAIPDDPRVRRQGDLLHNSGYDVIAIGLSGAKSPVPEWRCLSADDLLSTQDADNATQNQGGLSAPRNSFYNRFCRFLISSLANFKSALIHAAYRIIRISDLVRVHFQPSHALKVYWRLNDKFFKIYNLAKAQNVDLWVVNDWTTLPIALRLLQETGTAFAYDTHELAIDEYAHNLKWRLTQRPIISSIESAAIVEAKFVTCVSAGIAERLYSQYGMNKRPTVVRNMPSYIKHHFRNTPEKIKVLYHGVVSSGRGLEEAISSVRFWRKEFEFTIRGPAEPAYLRQLREIAIKYSVAERVIFAPPIPMTKLIEEGRLFDIGLFVIDGYSEQNLHVLPNKFFEYCMSGLALCVSNLPEMQELVNRYSLGRLIGSATAESIAFAINSLDRFTIDSFKNNSLLASQDLCWDKESFKLLELIQRTLYQLKQ
jgi:glycosyltransferase involved in cell wall biosynthesis